MVVMDSAHAPGERPGDPPGPSAQDIPGVVAWDTLCHLVDVEVARARRYGHPFALVRVALESQAGAARLREVTGALRLHTRWADSVGIGAQGAVLVILRDTPADGALVALEKVRASLAEELGASAAGLGLSCASWRKGDDRDALLARLG
jgi:hypothetical protein